MPSDSTRTYHCSVCHGKTTEKRTTGTFQSIDRHGHVLTFEVCPDCWKRLSLALVGRARVEVL